MSDMRISWLIWTVSHATISSHLFLDGRLVNLLVVIIIQITLPNKVGRTFVFMRSAILSNISIIKDGKCNTKYARIGNDLSFH